MPVSAILAALALQVVVPPPDSQPLVVATGSGEAQQPADWVRLAFTLRGEGVDAAAAEASLARSQAVVAASLRAMKGVMVDPSNSGVTTADVRGVNCSPNNPFAARQRLSAGDCAVAGVIATLEVTARVSPADRAGDVTSLAAQAGGHDLNLRDSGVVSDTEARREATARAVSQAQSQAAAMAAATGGRLGRLIRVQEGDGASFLPQDILVTGSRIAPPPPPMSIPEAPMALASPLAFTAAPITRSARVTLVYELEGGR